MGQISPFSDLKANELPECNDWSWRMRHGIIDVKGTVISTNITVTNGEYSDEDNNPIRFVSRPDTLEFLDHHAHLLSLMSQGTVINVLFRKNVKNVNPCIF